MYREIICRNCRHTWTAEMYHENGFDEFIHDSQANCPECGSDKVELGDPVPPREIWADMMVG